jgi:hypothetical protein
MAFLRRKVARLASSLALVFIELKVETPLCVCNPLQGFHGNHKETITKSADPRDGNRAEPFDHSEVTLRGHGYEFY